MNQTIARWAFIGGAGGTLGRALAKRYFSAGYNLLLHYNRNVQAVNDLCTELRSTAPHNEQEIRMWQADFADLAALESSLQALLCSVPRLDVVVNTVAVSEYSLLSELDVDTISGSLMINIGANIVLSKLVAPKLRASDSGTIVFVSSIWGKYGACMESLYSAGKGALNTFTKALAKEYASMNIRVNAVAPGLFASAMNERLSCEETADFAANHCALARVGKVEEIVSAIYFLSSPESSYITGEILEVSGLYL